MVRSNHACATSSRSSAVFFDFPLKHVLYEYLEKLCARPAGGMEISNSQSQQIEGKLCRGRIPQKLESSLYTIHATWNGTSTFSIFHTTDTFDGFLRKNYEDELTSLLMHDDPTLHYALTVK